MKNIILESNLDPAIRRAKIGSLAIYEISESELQLLEYGNPDSNNLTIAASLLSIAASFFTTLLVTKIEDNRIYMTFVALTIISFIIGIVLLLTWIRKKKDNKNVIGSIKNRLPPEGIQEKIKS
ncbi:MAG: hypothetical protein WC854_13195 [Bacteroidales bacterium]